MPSDGWFAAMALPAQRALQVTSVGSDRSLSPTRPITSRRGRGKPIRRISSRPCTPSMPDNATSSNQPWRQKKRRPACLGSSSRAPATAEPVWLRTARRWTNRTWRWRPRCAEASIAIDAGVSSLVTAAAQIAADIDNVRSDAANEMAVGNDLTALGYAGAPRTRARCHANGHATVIGGTVQGDAVLGGLTGWHADAKIGADAQASTIFRRPGAFGAVNIAGTA